MQYHFVMYWTDMLIYFLLFTSAVFISIARKKPYLLAVWAQIKNRRIGMITMCILAVYIIIAVLDSIHFQQYSTGTNGAKVPVAKVKSILDQILAPWADKYEETYSAPFASFLFVNKYTTNKSGHTISSKPALKYVSHIKDSKDKFILNKLLIGSAIGFVFWLVIFLAYMCSLKESINYTFIFTVLFLFLSIGALLMISKYFHVFGTNKIGQDVFYESIKSIRTGLVIGTITILIMLPFAVLLGILAGYLGGWVDDVIQYIYTTLSSIPSVLLIAASILSIQVFISNHQSMFHTSGQRADVRLLALCIILGVTSWTSLCRIVRGETLKIRELDYVASAKVLGMRTRQIIIKHILPNVLHVVIITVVLDFSLLVLAEAVLSYVGIGVDPTTISWGNMINSARLQLARDPIIWWTLAGAFIFMFGLVLSANLFSDVVRDAFDPRMRKRA